MKAKTLSWTSAVALLRSISSHLDGGVMAESATTCALETCTGFRTPWVDHGWTIGQEVKPRHLRHSMRGYVRNLPKRTSTCVESLKYTLYKLYKSQENYNISGASLQVLKKSEETLLVLENVTLPTLPLKSAPMIIAMASSTLCDAKRTTKRLFCSMAFLRNT